VVEVKTPIYPLQNDDGSRYSQDSYQASKHTVRELPPAPPVHKIASSPDLRDTDNGPGKPHEIAVYLYGFIRKCHNRAKRASTIWDQRDGEI